MACASSVSNKVARWCPSPGAQWRESLRQLDRPSRHSWVSHPRIKKFGPCMRLDYPNVNSDLFRAHSSHDLPLDCHTFLAPCQISSMVAVTRRTVRAGSTLRFPLDTSTAIALTLVDVGQRTNHSASCRRQHFDQQRMSSALVQSGVCARLR